MKKILFLAVSAAMLAVSCDLHVSLIPNNGDPDNPSPYTDDDPGPEPGTAVDMGLSVLWATCNLGAAKPEEYGNWYQWGDTAAAVYSNMGMAGYKWFASIDGYNYEVIKYNNYERYGIVDDRLELVPEDDAATVALGGKWRLPTGEEMRELKQNTEREYIDVNGVRCIKLTASNGNSIILPAAGHDMNPARYEGWYYWTSTLAAHDCAFAYIPQYSSGIGTNIGEIISTNAERYGELSIRPVYGDRVPRTYVPHATTRDIPESRVDGAVVRGSVTSLQSLDEISEYGLCISRTSDQPAVSDMKVPCAISDGQLHGEDFEFVHTVTGLLSETVYNVRTYAIVGGKTLYGRVLSFETLVDPNSIDQTSKLVDLGLGVSWAGWNIGAEKPQEAGGYFAWGDTEDRTGGTSSVNTYKWVDPQNGRYTKYVPSNESWAGTVTDNLHVLLPEDDVAHANWGENWRMPTREEWNALKDSCVWKSATIGDMQGYKVTGPNGNSIFLPLAGFVGSGGQVYLNEWGMYWSSTQRYDGYAYRPDVRLTRYAYYAYFEHDAIHIGDQYNARYNALSVRAVWDVKP